MDELREARALESRREGRDALISTLALFGGALLGSIDCGLSTSMASTLSSLLFVYGTCGTSIKDIIDEVRELARDDPAIYDSRIHNLVSEIQLAFEGGISASMEGMAIPLSYDQRVPPSVDMMNKIDAFIGHLRATGRVTSTGLEVLRRNIIEGRGGFNQYLQHMIANGLTPGIAAGRAPNIRMERIDRSTFTTLELINALLIETQGYSDILARLFPERLSDYSDRMLSRVWRGRTKSDSYIENVKQVIKKRGFTFPDTSLLLLARNLDKILGDSASGCLQLIRKYENNEIDELQLIDRLKAKLGKVSGEVPVTDIELSLILTGTEVFIRNIRSRITDPDNPGYNPNYKFSLEKLDIFKRNFQVIFGQRAKNCIKIINDYERLNPDLKEYSKQQYTITNPNYFKNMEGEDQFYWLGFLWSDGSMESKIHRVKLELSTQDRKSVVKFAKVMGLETSRIYDYLRFYYDKNGDLKYSEMSYAKFSCRPMADQLRDLGFLEFKSGRIGLPQVVLSALIDAKREASRISNPGAWYYTKSGMLALSFLFGFYDGDGHYRGGLSANIYSTNKMILDEIKVLFGIENRVRLHTIHSEYANEYELALGPDLFAAMLEIYKDSMIRKRPLQLSEGSNFLGEQED